MADLRIDGPSGRCVLVAAGRAARPHTTRLPPPPEDRASCPFCPGHEALTPPEVARVGPGPADGPGWRVRVVPNLYPIVTGCHAPEVAGTAATRAGPERRATEGREPTASLSVGGAHEVVVLSPDHGRSFGDLTDDEAVTVLAVMRDRCRAHLDGGAAWATAVLNHGRAAGASIAHPHGQVFALDVLPPVPGRRSGSVRPGTDPLTADLGAARRAGLVVAEAPAPVWLPVAGWVPYLLRLAATTAEPVFADAGDEAVRCVALALRDTLSRLGAVLGAVPYNVVVHTGPREGPDRDGGLGRWWLEVVPRLGVPAGFEMATGWWVNVTPPEVAVLRLRP